MYEELGSCCTRYAGFAGIDFHVETTFDLCIASAAALAAEILTPSSHYEWSRRHLTRKPFKGLSGNELLRQCGKPPQPKEMSASYTALLTVRLRHDPIANHPREGHALPCCMSESGKAHNIWRVSPDPRFQLAASARGGGQILG